MPNTIRGFFAGQLLRTEQALNLAGRTESPPASVSMPGINYLSFAVCGLAATQGPRMAKSIDLAPEASRLASSRTSNARAKVLAFKTWNRRG